MTKLAEKHHDFNEKLADGEKYEEYFEQAMDQIVWREAERISYDEDAAAQLRGIDLKLKTHEYEDVQIKARKPKYCCEDIFYETISVREEAKAGWGFTYDNILVVYAWLNKARTNFQDAVLFRVDDEFRNWANPRIDEFQLKETSSKHSGKIWHTEGRIIPLKDIPRRFIRYRDRQPPWVPLPDDIVTKQQTLDFLLDDG